MANNDINQFTVKGNLTRDAELKTLTSGTAICEFSIANNRYRKDKESKVNYLNCKLFGKIAESLNQYLTKGTAVLLSGEMNESRWEKDGVKHSRYELNVDFVQLLGNSNKSDSAPEPQDIDEEDIPF